MHVKKLKKEKKNPELCLQRELLFAADSEFPPHDLLLILKADAKFNMFDLKE